MTRFRNLGRCVVTTYTAVSVHFFENPLAHLFGLPLSSKIGNQCVVDKVMPQSTVYYVPGLVYISLCHYRTNKANWINNEVKLVALKV